MSINVIYCYFGEPPVAKSISIFDMLYRSIRSIKLTTRSNVSVHVVYTKISDTQIKRLESLSDNHISVVLHKLVPTVESGNTQQSLMTTVDAFRSLDIDGPVIAIDADTIVRDDISDIISYGNQSGMSLCGVRDYHPADQVRSDGYVNIGVLYIRSIKEFKEKTLPASDINYDKLVWRYSAQDYINHVFHGFIGYLPVAYNTMMRVSLANIRNISRYYGEDFADQTDFINRSKIVHYSDGVLPHSKECPEIGSQIFDEFDEIQYKESCINILYYAYTNSTVPDLFDNLEISVKSILLHRDVSNKYSIVVVTQSEVAVAAIKDRLSSLSRENFLISVINLKIPLVHTRSEILASKLYAFDYACHKFKRFIYLDLDTLVLKDLRELFDSNLYGNPVGGVEDVPLVYKRKTKEIGYINSGVLLFDSTAVINQIGGNLHSYAEEVARLKYHDQDWVNNTFSHTLLCNKFNTMVNDYLDTVEETKLHDATVLHYAGSFYNNIRSKNCPASEVLNSYESSLLPSHKKPQKILLARVHRAFGDWIIFADVLKAINEAYPDIEVDVLDNGNARLDILTECGCRYKLVFNPDISEYAGYDPHVLYNTDPVTPNEHIIVSALKNTCRKIPILDIGKFSQINLVSPVSLPENYQVPTGDYVIVPHWYPPLISSKVKDYSQENYEELVRLLSNSGYNVYELNSGSVEYRYSEEKKSFDRSIGIITTRNIRETAKLLKNAKFCVLIENGMNHWACHNGARSYCLFKSPTHAHPDSLAYRTMIPIECYNNESPEYVFSEIMKHEEKQ